MSAEKTEQHHQENKDPQPDIVASPSRYDRGSLSGETAIGDAHQEFGNKVMVDTARASEIRPSKLSGRKLNWMVTFVAGTGVCWLAGFRQDSSLAVDACADISLRCLATIKECGCIGCCACSSDPRMSALLTLPAFEETFPMTADGFGNPRAATLQSFMVAIYEIGCMAGALSNLYVGDKLGRRHTIAL